MNIPDLSDIQDLEVSPEGEYALKIISCKEVTSGKTGREGYSMVIHNLNGDSYLPIFHSIWFPMDSDDNTKTNTMWRMVKEFITALDMPPGDVGPADFVGVEFSGLVGIKKNERTDNDENYLIKVTS